MTGNLVVFTYVTKGILPVPDCVIYVTDIEKTKLLAKLVTDRNGRTETIELEAPDIKNSLTPNSFLPAFRSVSVFCTKPGYFSLLINGVQIFADRTSVQATMMLPIPDNFEGDTTEVIEIPPQNL